MLRLGELEKLVTGKPFVLKIYGFPNIYKLLNTLGFKMSIYYSTEEIEKVCYSDAGIDAGVSMYFSSENMIVLNRTKIDYNLLRNMVVTEINNAEESVITLCYEKYLN